MEAMPSWAVTAYAISIALYMVIVVPYSGAKNAEEVWSKGEILVLFLLSFTFLRSYLHIVQIQKEIVNT